MFSKIKIFLVLSFLLLAVFSVTSKAFAADTPSVGDFVYNVVNPYGSVFNGIKSLIYGNELKESGICPLFQPLTALKESFGSNEVGVYACAYQILYLVLMIMAWLTSLVTMLFDAAFQITVVDMKSFVDGIGIIQIGWIAIRDLANILFIFMLLYLAISTILQLDEHGVKHGLSRLIIGAVLINFSLFFVKIPIDVSNILAIQISNKIQVEGGGIGTAFLSSFNFQSINIPISLVTDTSSSNPLVSDDDKERFDKFEKSAIAFAASSSPITTFTMGIIMMFILTLVFLSVVVIFVKRLISLIMLMILSPLAFAGMAIPNHDIEHQISHNFWSKLIKESFYAPAFMFIIYIGLTIISSDGYKQSIFEGGTSFAGGLIQVGTIVNYIVVIIIFIFALSVSEMFGVEGSSQAMKAFGAMRAGITGWVGKNTVGTLAYNTLEKTKFGTERLKQMRQGIGKDGKLIENPLLRGITRGVGNTVTGTLSKIGEGHHHDIEKDMAATKDTLNELRDDPQKQAVLLGEMLRGHKADLGKNFTGLIHPYDQKVAKYVATAMKDDEVATMVQFMRDAGKNEEAATVLDYLGKERRANIDEMISNKVTRYHKIKLGDHATGLGLVDQYESSRKKMSDGSLGDGSISVDLEGHGHMTTLSGDQAIDYLNKNYGVTADTNTKKLDSSPILDKTKAMFNGFSEKQKADVLTTLSNEQQKALAANKEFIKEMNEHFTNYRMIDSAMKGSMAKELQEKLGLIAYDGVTKYYIDTALRSKKLKEELESKDSKIKKGAEELQKSLLEKWKNYNNGDSWVESYGTSDDAKKKDEEMANKILEYKTLVKAKANFTRVAKESAEFQEISDMVNKGYVPKE